MFEDIQIYQKHMEFGEEPMDVSISSEIAGFSKEEIDYVNVSITNLYL